MHIQQYIRLLRDGWWIILALVLISAGAGIAYSYAQIPVYEATATFVVNPGARIAQTYDLLYSIDTLAGRTSLATTYANVLKSRLIIDKAAASLSLPPETLTGYKISAVVLPDSSVISLHVEGASPDLTANLANAIGNAGLEYIKGLQEIYELRYLDTAVANLTPISPDHLVNVTLSAVIGLIGALAFLVLRQMLFSAFNEELPTSTTAVISKPVESKGLEIKGIKDAGHSTSLQTNLSSSQLD